MKRQFAEVISEWLEDFIAEDILQRDIQIPDIKNLKEIYAITGPRRAGKTFLMYQIILNIVKDNKYKKEDVLFIDFEDYRLADITGADIDELFTTFVKLTGQMPVFLFFDEIQHLPDWGRILRTLHNKRKFKIVVSGSNSELLSKEIATELRGRYLDTLIMPYSFNEFLKYKKIKCNKRIKYLPERGNIIKAFDEYISNSSFPEVIMKTSQKERRNILQNYYQTIFYRDIIDRYNIKAKEVLNELMRYVINTSSELFSISSFEKTLKRSEISTSKRTISNYLRYLEDAFFVILNQKFSYSPKKRMMNPIKLYLIDTGFSSLGTHFSQNKGKLLENIVAIELYKYENEVFYYKEKQECDFIIKGNTKLETAIQVCWEINDRNLKRELGALIEVKNSLNTKKNIVLTYDQEETITYKSNSFELIPVWKWLIEDNILSI